jgi:hypothetical protein
MTAHPMIQTLTNLRLSIRRYAWWLMLSLVLVVATFAAFRSVSMPTASVPVVSGIPRTMSVDPTQQGVFEYLWAHRSKQPIQAPSAKLDQAQQGVMKYVHAHNRVDQPATLWDQATQAVLDYLRAHS